MCTKAKDKLLNRFVAIKILKPAVYAMTRNLSTVSEENRRLQQACRIPI